MTHKIKNIDLFIGHLGNGATCCDRSREKNGDFLKVAHIDETGIIKWYEPVNDHDKSQIEAYAWQTYGENFQILKFIHLIYPKCSYTKLEEELPREQLLHNIIRTHKGISYSILIYRHKFAPKLYDKDIFYTYTIHRKSHYL